MSDLKKALLTFLGQLSASIDKFKKIVEEESPSPAPDPVPVPDPTPGPVPTPIPTPVPTPTPTPVPVPSGKIFGWNLGGVDYWSQNKILSDALWMCSLQTGQPHQRPAKFDEEGALMSGDANTRFTVDGRLHSPGTYKFNYIEKDNNYAAPLSLTVDPDDRDQWENVVLSGDMRSVRCTKDGQATAMCESFKTRVIDTPILRFMDLRGTNYPNHSPDGWYRTQYDLTRGAWENGQWDGVYTIVPTITPPMAVAIAKILRSTTIWWNVHFDDIDEKTLATARYFDENFDGTVIYEYGNENWNWFPNLVSDRLYKEYGGDWNKIGNDLRARTNRMGSLVKSKSNRAIVAMGTQCVNYGVTESLLKGPIDNIDAICGAPYFGTTSRCPGTWRDLITLCETEQKAIQKAVIDQRDIAKRAGLRFFGYEAGSHLWIKEDGPGTTPEPEKVRIIDALRSDELARVYESFIQFWRNEINEPLCFFTECHKSSFGHCEWAEQGYQPRGRVVQQAIRA